MFVPSDVVYDLSLIHIYGTQTTVSMSLRQDMRELSRMVIFITANMGDVYKRQVRELKTIQDWVIERNLRSVSGVADIVSFGGEVKTFEVSVNPHQLINYGITSLELYDAIAKMCIRDSGSGGRRYSCASNNLAPCLQDKRSGTHLSDNGCIGLCRQ